MINIVEGIFLGLLSQIFLLLIIKNLIFPNLINEYDLMNFNIFITDTIYLIIRFYILSENKSFKLIAISLVSVLLNFVILYFYSDITIITYLKNIYVIITIISI